MKMPLPVAKVLILITQLLLARIIRERMKYHRVLKIHNALYKNDCNVFSMHCRVCAETVQPPPFSSDASSLQKGKRRKHY